MLDPCARESKARIGEVSKGKTDLWSRSVFFLREPTRSDKQVRLLGRFSEMLRYLGAWMLARARASPAQGLRRHEPRYQYIFFIYYVSIT